MALTREFRTTLHERAQRDAKFRREMLREGVETMLAGDVAAGKAILRDYINASIGFRDLAAATHIPAKSLMRMFGPSGNPRADNLFQVIGHLQHEEGMALKFSHR
ncbi:MAG: transcriptional regulator [Alphaproteobacteria bacterium]